MPMKMNKSFMTKSGSNKKKVSTKKLSLNNTVETAPEKYINPIQTQLEYYNKISFKPVIKNVDEELNKKIMENVNNLNSFREIIEYDCIVNLAKNHLKILGDLCDQIINDEPKSSYITVQETILNLLSNNPSNFVKVIHKKFKTYVQKRNILNCGCIEILEFIEEFNKKINVLSELIRFSVKNKSSMDLIVSIGYYIIYNEIFG